MVDFSMNTTVTAKGMQINATAGQSLTISNAINGTYDQSAEADTAAQLTMKPCTSADGKTFGILGTGVEVKKTNLSNATWTGVEGAFAAADLVVTTEDTYIYEDTFYIKSTSSSAGTVSLYVSSIEVSRVAQTGASDTDIAKALRVSITMGTTTLIFAPVDGYELNLEGGNGKAGLYNASSSTWSLAVPTYTTAGSTAVLGTLTNNEQASAVSIKIWFEGQDANCKTDNVSTAHTASSVTVNFSSTNS